MTFARSGLTKNNGTSTVIPPLPVQSKLQSKRPSFLLNSTQKEKKLLLANESISQPTRDELEDIVSNLSTIVKKSEQLLTPVKPILSSVAVRRTASLHLTKLELDRRKAVKSSTSQPHIVEKNEDQRTKLHESISDRSSECSTNVSNITRRSSIRSSHNVEKYSGIKCSLPTFTSTVPNIFKGLEKHLTPTKDKLLTNSTPFMEKQFTPINSSRKEKSPWRLRFEKFLNHQEATPLSVTKESETSSSTKTSSTGKENRTPSFRLPARRMSRCNLPS